MYYYFYPTNKNCFEHLVAMTGIALREQWNLVEMQVWSLQLDSLTSS